MTSMLHISGDPFDAQLQQAQLQWVCSSHAGATGLAENYAGCPWDCDRTVSIVWVEARAA
jgi:p-hydroxybenzoate 3-monooxygenase